MFIPLFLSLYGGDPPKNQIKHVTSRVVTPYHTNIIVFELCRNLNSKKNVNHDFQSTQPGHNIKYSTMIMYITVLRLGVNLSPLGIHIRFRCHNDSHTAAALLIKPKCGLMGCRILIRYPRIVLWKQQKYVFSIGSILKSFTWRFVSDVVLYISICSLIHLPMYTSTSASCICPSPLLPRRSDM